MKVKSHHHTQDVKQLYGPQPPRRHVSLAWVTSPLWPETQTQEVDPELGLSLNDLMNIKHTTEAEKKEDAEHWGTSSPTPGNFLCNQLIQEICQKSTASLSHALLIVVAECFKAKWMPKKLSKTGNIQQVHKVVTQCQEITWTSGLIHWLRSAGWFCNLQSVHLLIWFCC